MVQRVQEVLDPHAAHLDAGDADVGEAAEEVAQDEGGDGDCDFRKRTLMVFAPSSAPGRNAVTVLTKEAIPFGKVNPMIACSNFN